MSEVSLTGLTSYGRFTAAAEPIASGGKAPQGGKVLPPVAPQVNRPAEKVAELHNPSEKVQAAVAQMNEYIQSTQRDLMFSYDEEIGSTIVKVLDRKTQEVIRQIPDDIFLELARTLKQDEPIPLFRAQV